MLRRYWLHLSDSEHEAVISYLRNLPLLRVHCQINLVSIVATCFFPFVLILYAYLISANYEIIIMHKYLYMWDVNIYSEIKHLEWKKLTKTFRFLTVVNSFPSGLLSESQSTKLDLKEGIWFCTPIINLIFVVPSIMLYSSKISPTRWINCVLFFAMALLYMFRATISPIIRSTYAVYDHR